MNYRVVVLALMVLSAACGSEAATEDDGFSVSPASLGFGGEAGVTTEPATQQLTIESGSGTVYLELAYGGIAYEATPLVIDGATAIATVRVPAPAIAGAGVHTGSVTIRGYEEPFAGSEVHGSPKTVPVTYNVAGMAASASPVVFNQTSGSLPAPSAVVISDGLGGDADYAWSVVTDSGSIDGLPELGWLAVEPTAGTGVPAELTVSVVAQGQAGIEYWGSFTVTNTEGALLRVTVIYRAH